MESRLGLGEEGVDCQVQEEVLFLDATEGI